MWEVADLRQLGQGRVNGCVWWVLIRIEELEAGVELELDLDWSWMGAGLELELTRK